MSRIEQLEKMLAESPEDDELHYMMAQERLKAGEHERAIDAFDACLRLKPDHHYAYFHKARALEALGRKDEAVEALRDGAARARKQNDAKATNELVNYLEELDPR